MRAARPHSLLVEPQPACRPSQLGAADESEEPNDVGRRAAYSSRVTAQRCPSTAGLAVRPRTERSLDISPEAPSITATDRRIANAEEVAVLDVVALTERSSRSPIRVAQTGGRACVLANDPCPAPARMDRSSR